MGKTMKTKLPSKHNFERVTDCRFRISFPENGMYFEVGIIKDAKYGAWPFRLEYSYHSLDTGGLGTYGSAKKLESLDDIDAEMDKLINELGPKSKKAMEVAKTFSREWSPGFSYILAPNGRGLHSRGFYFESFRDMETYLRLANSFNCDYVAAVVYTPNGEPSDYLGQYRIKVKDFKPVNIEFIKKVNTDR